MSFINISGFALAPLLLVAVSSPVCADNFKLGGDCIVFDYDTNFPKGAQVVSTYHWSGACDAGGFATGPGELDSYWNGRLDEASVGTMVGGRLEGKVVTTSPKGERFEGIYSHGRRSGYGVYAMTRNGLLVLRYEGDFVDGLADGHGVETTAAGRYEGNFSKGKREE